MAQQKTYIFLLVLIFSMFSTNIFYAQSKKIDKVVIDAGHGGKDPGACGKKSYEKDIVLSIALKLGKYINQNFPDVKVIYTRSTDEFIELNRRSQIANENKADLFISIHCNSSVSPEPYGFETYVMAPTKNKANLDVAKKENASVLLEDNYQLKYDGFDPNTPEGEVIFSLYQNKYLEMSQNLAFIVQKQFRERLKRLDKGVKQAGFLVLFKTAMPSILIEAGFLSNPEEEKFLITEHGQDYIATSIYSAFKEYKANLEGTDVKKDDTDKVEFKDLETKNDSSAKTQPVVNNNPVKPNNQEVKTDPVKTTDTKNNPVIKNTETPKVETKQDVVFRVQILVSPKKLSTQASDFKGEKEIFEYQDASAYKYSIGNFTKLEAASAEAKRLREKGFNGAFIVAFSQGKRISLDDARKLINN